MRLSSPTAPRLVAAAAEAAAGRPFETSGWCYADDMASQDLARQLGLDRLILTRFEALG